MKISGIFLNQNSNISTFNRQSKRNLAPKTNNLDSAVIFEYMTQRSYPNFTGTAFDKTVDANYFQLPKGARADIFQKAAAQNIYLDNDVLVTAPTGTGKTAIAHYAITKNLHNGEKTFYTTPLKALSNEKFRDFQKIYGKENVGILTGDTKINKEAPVLIMTTEVYRNMVFGEKFGRHNDLLDGLKTVIFDELHYLGDVDRGGIWEQSIFLSKPEVQLLSLSATIGNNKEISGWMAKIREQSTPEIVSGKNNALKNYKANENLPIHTVLIDVPTENRHVPLEFENINIKDLTTPSKSKKKSKFNEQIDRLDKLAAKKGIIPAYAYINIVQKLKDEDKLPAIFFVFDKRNSKDILEHLTKYGPKLTTDEERAEIQRTIDDFEQAGKYLGESLNTKALLKGYAVHNAGLLPTQKELVEELFQRKLIKTVIATETLSAGINMPTRTTVITATRKPSSTPDGEDNKRSITPNEFHQMAGRAGRRGIDKIGYCYTLSMDDDQSAIFNHLVKSKPNNIKSAFRPDYSFITKYFEECSNDEMLNFICEKSLFTYNQNDTIARRNKQNLKNIFTQRIKILKDFGYLDSKNRLSNKAILLSNLNGYEQIPIMEMVDSRIFKGMTPVELAASVSALANIDFKKETKLKYGHERDFQKFEHQDRKLENYIAKLNQTLGEYNDLSRSTDKTFRPLEVNSELTKSIYAWADANSKNDNSILNWGNLYYNSDKRDYKDEGSLFKGIMMTIDLLKQLKTVTQHGAEISNSQEEFEYYADFNEKIDQAISLINREPSQV